MFKNSKLNKVILVLALVVVVNLMISTDHVNGQKGKAPATTTKKGAKAPAKKVLTTVKTTKTTTKAKRTTKKTTKYFTPSKYQTSCYTCNQHLLNPRLTFINNLRHFRNTCQKVDKRNIDQCRFAGSCYTAKFGPYYVRGCISRRTCQLFKKTKNISRLNIANFQHFNPDSFDCCKGNLCNKKKLKSSSVKTMASPVFFNIVILVLANSVVKIFS